MGEDQLYEDLLNVMRTGEAHISLHNDAICKTIDWVTSNPREYLTLHSLSCDCLVWFPSSFILGPSNFEGVVLYTAGKSVQSLQNVALRL
ncbi:hypothetical protein CDAR_263791 [Caerostris darwini]|uniref:Uncharacterized protein n=1 Tax=Caerostris darwini TaxID=1538125 RepID=A0AAV4VM71_9ARAC|nr:hypothetical protein CDAR_263791 [Caerostris darwini]